MFYMFSFPCDGGIIYHSMMPWYSTTSVAESNPSYCIEISYIK